MKHVTNHFKLILSEQYTKLRIMAMSVGFHRRGAMAMDMAMCKSKWFVEHRF